MIPHMMPFTAVNSGDMEMEWEVNQGMNDGGMIESHSSDSIEDEHEKPQPTEDVFELQDVSADVKIMCKSPKAIKDALEPTERAKNRLEPQGPTQNVMEPPGLIKYVSEPQESTKDVTELPVPQNH